MTKEELETIKKSLWTPGTVKPDKSFMMMGQRNDGSVIFGVYYAPIGCVVPKDSANEPWITWENLNIKRYINLDSLLVIEGQAESKR